MLGDQHQAAEDEQAVAMSSCHNNSDQHPDPSTARVYPIV